MIIVYFLTWALGALIGGALFMLLPIAYNTKSIGHRYVWLSMFAIKRGAFVLQDDGELNWKKIKYDPIGSEKVSIGDDIVTISDPARALGTFKDRTLALSDEIHGIVFRVSDAAAGMRKRELEKKNLLLNPATEEDRNAYQISAWVRKFIHIPTNTPVDLRDVRMLATGSERGTDPWLVRVWYKFSRIRDKSATSILKLMLPVAGFLGVLIIIWQAKGSGGSSSSGSAPSNGTELNLLWFIFTPYLDTITKAGAIAMPCIIVVVGYALFGFVGGMLPFALFFGVISGFVFVCVFVLLISLIGAGAWLSTFFLDMGLQCFDNPTILETTDGYTLVDGDGDSPRHKLGKHWIHFEVTSDGLAKRDGYVGTPNEIVDSIPTESEKGYKKPTQGMDWYGYFIPSMPDSSKEYITSLDAFGSLARGFVGEDSSKRHKEAKEDFGDGLSDVSDRMIILATVGGMVLASIIGYFVL